MILTLSIVLTIASLMLIVLVLITTLPVLYKLFFTSKRTVK